MNPYKDKKSIVQLLLDSPNNFLLEFFVVVVWLLGLFCFVQICYCMSAFSRVLILNKVTEFVSGFYLCSDVFIWWQRMHEHVDVEFTVSLSGFISNCYNLTLNRMDDQQGPSM